MHFDLTPIHLILIKSNNMHQLCVTLPRFILELEAVRSYRSNSLLPARVQWAKTVSVSAGPYDWFSWTSNWRNSPVLCGEWISRSPSLLLLWPTVKWFEVVVLWFKDICNVQCHDVWIHANEVLIWNGHDRPSCLPLESVPMKAYHLDNITCGPRKGQLNWRYVTANNDAYLIQSNFQFSFHLVLLNVRSCQSLPW